MPNTTVYFINRGVVRVWKNFTAKNEADRRKIATLTNNDFFGEQSAMMEQEVCLHPPQTSLAPSDLRFPSSHGSSHGASRTPRVACRGRQAARAAGEPRSATAVLVLRHAHAAAGSLPGGADGEQAQVELATSKPRSRLGARWPACQDAGRQVDRERPRDLRAGAFTSPLAAHAYEDGQRDPITGYTSLTCPNT